MSANPELDALINQKLDELLPQLPAIALEGPKAVGKTESARRSLAMTASFASSVEQDTTRVPRWDAVQVGKVTWRQVLIG